MDVEKYKQELGRIHADKPFLENTKKLLLNQLTKEQESTASGQEKEPKGIIVLARRHSKQILLAACALVVLAGAGTVVKYLQEPQNVSGLMTTQGSLSRIESESSFSKSQAGEGARAFSGEEWVIPYSNQAPPNAVSEPVQVPEEIGNTRNVWVTDAQANSVPETMPVYGPQCIVEDDPVVAGTTGQSEPSEEIDLLRQEEMEQRAHQIAAGFGLTALPVPEHSELLFSMRALFTPLSFTTPDIMLSSSASASSSSASSSASQSQSEELEPEPPQPVVLQTEQAEITVFPNGAAQVLFTTQYLPQAGTPPAPEAEMQIHELYLEQVTQELQSAGALATMTNPVYEVQRVYDENQQQKVLYLIYENGDTLLDVLVQRDLFGIEMVLDEYGITEIYMFDGIREKPLMEYPVLTVEEAQQVLLDGMAFTEISGTEIPEPEMIAKIELSYEMADRGVYLPYYRFYVEVKSQEESFENQYIVWYVPAIRPEYWK